MTEFSVGKYSPIKIPAPQCTAALYIGDGRKRQGYLLISAS
ncbi:MAG: hypothetical protein O4808_08520 [Trichodesmium sp. St17_bin3_1_1]|nr:hypothetical protein [Trichodesmium sp. St18_bin1]MDE5107092.1 hypothetical protein [Trichodesmium sp. St17_bin3_1_1]